VPKIAKPEALFELIKTNHRRYLEQVMVSHLDIIDGTENRELVKEYVESIEDFKESQRRYLDSAIQGETLSTKLGNGALAALTGLGVGGGAYLLQQGGSIANFVQPLDMGKSALSGLFSVGLGAGAAYLTYQAFEAQANPELAVSHEKFNAILKKAGFTNQKYAELSEEIVKLFHYRECLLLGLKNKSDQNIRELFKANNLIPSKLPVDEQALNQAIEVYFIQQLNAIFNEAFKRIYVIHDEEIEADAKELEIIRWMKRHFEDPAEREKFTQNMQIQFLNQCINYLEDEMLEPSFIAKHKNVISGLSGLLTAGIVVTLGIALGASTLGIGLIAVAVAAISTAVMYKVITDAKHLKFKRDAENRNAIERTIKDIGIETRRLEQLVKNVEETQQEDINYLARFKDYDSEEGYFSRLVNTILQRPRLPAMGSSVGWMREYASRYRHSKLIENDLQPQHRDLIIRANAQTEQMQLALKQSSDQATVEAMVIPQDLLTLINDTRQYLANSDPATKEFINKFQLRNKIREQILEIVSIVAKDKILPQEIVDFYSQPIEQGGLAGNKQDLQTIRAIAPTVAVDCPLDSDHPLNELLLSAIKIDTAMTRFEDKKSPLYVENHNYILKGDNGYRDMLGLSIHGDSDNIEENITAGNIQTYLQASFDFLMALNRSQNYDGVDPFDTPFDHRSEYLLYQTLLLKQLAVLVDPNNLQVDLVVKRKIKAFVTEKFDIDAKSVFDNIITHSLTQPREKSGVGLNSLVNEGEVLDIEGIKHVADAIRLNQAYCEKPMTPRKLVSLAAEQFLVKRTEKYLFSIGDVQKHLRPTPSEAYVSLVEQTIENSSFFINEMYVNNLLYKTGSLTCYLIDVDNSLSALLKSIEIRDRQLTGDIQIGMTYQDLKTGEIEKADSYEFSNVQLKQAHQKITEFKNQLEATLRTDERLQQRSLFSSIYLFGKPSPKIRPLVDLREEVWQVIPARTESEILAEIIAELKAQREITKAEQNSQWFGGFGVGMFTGFSKQQKIEAIDKLVELLNKIYLHKSVDPAEVEAIIQDPIYKDGRLKDKVKQLNQLGIDDISQLADLVDKYDMSKEEQVQQPTEEQVQPFI
jgi:hypothetical protein